MPIYHSLPNTYPRSQASEIHKLKKKKKFTIFFSDQPLKQIGFFKLIN